ncbi:PP2C family protein-serine/threonine phosphatase [Streptacidiphilus monticola]
MGDVRGKGNGAVVTVATVLSTFREAAQVQPTLSGIAARIDRALALDQSDLGDGELFATAVLLEFPWTGRRSGCSTGACPAAAAGRVGVHTLEAPFALPLGLAELAPEAEAECAHPLTDRQVLLAFTDGVTEARGRDGTFYPLSERLAAHEFAGPAAAVSFVRRDVARWTTCTRDDMVVLGLQRTRGA